MADDWRTTHATTKKRWAFSVSPTVIIGLTGSLTLSGMVVRGQVRRDFSPTFLPLNYEHGFIAKLHDEGGAADDESPFSRIESIREERAWESQRKHSVLHQHR